MELSEVQKEALEHIKRGKFSGVRLCRKMGTERFTDVQLETMRAAGWIKWNGEYWEGSNVPSSG